MAFTTLTFLLFLAVVVTLHWSLRRGRNLLLLLVSYAFYGWWDARFLALLLASSLLDYGVGRGLDGDRGLHVRRLLLATSLAGNFGLLAWFKYRGFAAASLAAPLQLVGIEVEPSTISILLPIGISFYTFQTVGYTIDVYRGEIAAERRLLDYLLYVSFFPQLVAGPIERARSLLPQLAAQRRFDEAAARAGSRRILWGLFKKLALADGVAVVVDAAYGSSGASGPDLAIATVLFAFQIYWDFSAYSDIAIGSARLLGVELVENFDHPYFAASPAEFWRRWHVSLSTWLRDYLYVPLGGSRRGAPRTLANVLVVFALSGLWHGAAWHFVAWGAVNGLLLLPEVVLRPHGRRPKPRGPWARICGTVATFVAIDAAWILFRAGSVAEAGSIAARILRQAGDGVAWAHAIGASGWPLLAVASITTWEWWTRAWPTPLAALAWPRPARMVAYTALFWATIWLAPWTPQAFVYFRF